MMEKIKNYLRGRDDGLVAHEKVGGFVTIRSYVLRGGRVIHGKGIVVVVDLVWGFPL